MIRRRRVVDHLLSSEPIHLPPKKVKKASFHAAKIMEDFQSETDSDYTSYWRDWVSLLSLQQIQHCHPTSFSNQHTLYVCVCAWPKPRFQPTPPHDPGALQANFWEEIVAFNSVHCKSSELNSCFVLQTRHRSAIMELSLLLVISPHLISPQWQMADKPYGWNATRCDDQCSWHSTTRSTCVVLKNWMLWSFLSKCPLSLSHRFHITLSISPIRATEKARKQDS